MQFSLIRMSAITPAAMLVSLFAAVGVAQAVPVTLTITRVRALVTESGEGLEGAGQSTADLYAKVTINGVNFSTLNIHVDDAPIIEPFWVFSTNVPLAQGTANVTIRIFEHDSTSADVAKTTTPANAVKANRPPMTVRIVACTIVK